MNDAHDNAITDAGIRDVLESSDRLIGTLTAHVTGEGHPSDMLTREELLEQAYDNKKQAEQALVHVADLQAMLEQANDKLVTVREHAEGLEASKALLERELESREATGLKLERDKAETESMLAHEQQAVWKARHELEAFKQQVVEVAAREADERDWCDEINGILKELGLELPAKQVEINYTVNVRMTAYIRPGSGMSASRNDVRNSLDTSVIEDVIRDCDPLDSDWNDVDVQSVYVDVNDVDFGVMLPEQVVAHMWSKVVVAGPAQCWEWQKTGRDQDGYGIFWVPGVGSRRVTRLIFELEHGYLPRICRHSCDNPPCCNPAHLLDGTHDDNVRDRVQRGRSNNQHRSQLECKHGHPFTPENTYITPSTGSRRCITCRKAYEIRRSAT